MTQIRKLLLAASRVAPDGLEFRWSREGVDARMASGRTQRIRYREEGSRWRFETTVSSARDVDALDREEFAQEMLVRNRTTPVVAFGLDGKGRLIAWVEHPASTLQPVELALILASLARAADRLEWLLTARDVN